MPEVKIFTVLFALPLCLILPSGIGRTALGINNEALWEFGEGLLVLSVGAGALLCFLTGLKRLSTFEAIDGTAPGLSADVLPLAQMTRLMGTRRMTLCVVLALQFVCVTRFFMILDGHVIFRAALWSYGYYLASAAMIRAFAASWPWVWRGYFVWAWIPILAVGMPLSKPVLLEMGLIYFSPITWHR